MEEKRPKYHGIKYDKDRENGYGYHAMGSFLPWMLKKFVFKANIPKNHFDNKFEQGVRKYLDCNRKFTRLAELIGNEMCMPKEEDYNCNIMRNTETYVDIPMYLEMMFIYLRTEVDCLGDVIPYFYEYRDKERIRKRNFRKQINWFRENKEIDLAYAKILEENTKWFVTLSDKVRDIVVHHRGIVDVYSSMLSKQRGYIFYTSLVKDSGRWCKDTNNEEIDIPIEDFAGRKNDDKKILDVKQILIEIVKDYFIYLDLTYDHFAKRYLPPGNILEIRTPFKNGPLPSFWVYPKIND